MLITKMPFCTKKIAMVLLLITVWLQGHIAGIRQDYTKDFTNKDLTKRQVAVATYLIDKLALRAGNEKVWILTEWNYRFHSIVWWNWPFWLQDDDEADTVGCCTLKVENVKPKPPNILKVDYAIKTIFFK